jgi:hypothetical protein
MILLMFVLAPIAGLISEFGLGIVPWPAGVVVLLLGMGGILRIAYALMFESKYPALIEKGNAALHIKGGPVVTAALPESHYEPPVSVPTVSRRDREEAPASVTENTTKLLEKDSE